jgi:hypothetical protein
MFNFFKFFTADGREESWFDPKALFTVKFMGLLLVAGLGVVALAASGSPLLGVLAALATAAGSAAFGFLFGIPRVAVADGGADNGASGGRQVRMGRPIGTLEQVVDWLTKILLGAGLTQLHELKLMALKYGEVISVCVRTEAGVVNPLGHVFGLAVIGYFGPVGFLGGYLSTRLVLARLLTKEDLEQERISRAAAREEGRRMGLEEGRDETVRVWNQEKLKALGAQQQYQANAAGVNVLEQAKKWEPGLPVTNKDDPQKNRFGGNHEANGRRLVADVTPLSDGEGEVFKVLLRVVSTDDKNPLTSPVKFFLHDTFQPDTICVVPKQRVAQLDLRAIGAFTVGAITDDGKTSLELDLEFLESAPEKFRKR